MRQHTMDKLARVDAGHDWLEGPICAGPGVSRSSADLCRYCGLVRRRRWEPTRLSEAETTFVDYSGEDIPLRDVEDSCHE